MRAGQVPPEHPFRFHQPQSISFYNMGQGFPVGPEVKTLMQEIPGRGTKIPHALQCGQKCTLLDLHFIQHNFIKRFIHLSMVHSFFCCCHIVFCYIKTP